MKHLNLSFFSSCVLLLVSGCARNEEPFRVSFPMLNPAHADTGAGSWKTILLKAPDELAVATPTASTAADYRLELQEILARQEQKTKTDDAALDYWGTGTVLRWNEILRELVAKYNLPTVENPDGSYPHPSNDNPLAYPYFPFSNPPYAARAYAYVSAAQYDALVAATYYRQKFRRPNPSHTHSNIRELIPVAGDYSYPSDDITAAGAAVALMKLLFPGEQAYLEEKLQECINTMILSGTCVRSDAEAGEKLGREVAQKFISRARNDRAGSTVGTPIDWKKLEEEAIARGEIPWISQETPKRPPMLPLFGKVSGFLVDSAEMISNRPVPPPSVHSEQFKKELAEVKAYSKSATREQFRIVHFWGDGVGTYTPPGHWNAIACEDFVKERFSEVRWARNLALLNMSMMDAVICCWDTKFYYFNPRPSQIDPEIKTLTGLPNFPSYTSGHSTFSGAAAALLAHVVPQRADAYFQMANEASLSRLYGAIHYRSDIDIGLNMGIAIGQKAVERARTDGAE